MASQLPVLQLRDNFHYVICQQGFCLMASIYWNILKHASFNFILSMINCDSFSEWCPIDMLRKSDKDMAHLDERVDTSPSPVAHFP